MFHAARERIAGCDRNGDQSGRDSELESLYATPPEARTLAAKARAILVFPEIVKGGFIVAGQYGDRALRKGGKTVAYYRSVAASYGFQAGVQAFSDALFFMDEESLSYLAKSEGWDWVSAQAS